MSNGELEKLVRDAARAIEQNAQDLREAIGLRQWGRAALLCHAVRQDAQETVPMLRELEEA